MIIRIDMTFGQSRLNSKLNPYPKRRAFWKGSNTTDILQ